MEIKTQQDVLDYIEEHHSGEHVMTYPEYAEAFMGVAHQGLSNYVAVYNREMCLEILARDEEDDGVHRREDHEVAEGVAQGVGGVS